MRASLSFEVCSSLRTLDNNQILHVGGALSLSFTVLQRMKQLPKDMVAAWLRKENHVRDDPPWKTLIDVLGEVEQAGVARTMNGQKLESVAVGICRCTAHVKKCS